MEPSCKYNRAIPHSGEEPLPSGYWHEFPNTILEPSDITILQTREVYRSDIKNAEWKTLMNYVGTLTFEKLGVSVLRRQMFNDLPVSGKLCLNTHVLGRD